MSTVLILLTACARRCCRPCSRTECARRISVGRRRRRFSRPLSRRDFSDDARSDTECRIGNKRPKRRVDGGERNMSVINESIAISVPTDTADRRRRIVAIVGASSGNLVEWYDFYAYAFTSIYFASAFFPSGDATSQLLATAGIFAVGFFMRPL